MQSRFSRRGREVEYLQSVSNIANTSFSASWLDISWFTRIVLIRFGVFGEEYSFRRLLILTVILNLIIL